MVTSGWRRVVARERAELRSIPFFCPLYRGAYGKVIVVPSLALGFLLYSAMVAAMHPWTDSYSVDERVLMTVVLLPAGLLAPLFASYPVVVLLNGIDVIGWALTRKLRTNLGLKLQLIVIPIFATTGTFLYRSPDLDVNAAGIFFAFVLAPVCAWLFVHISWLENYSAGRPVVIGAWQRR